MSNARFNAVLSMHQTVADHEINNHFLSYWVCYLLKVARLHHQPYHADQQKNLNPVSQNAHKISKCVTRYLISLAELLQNGAL